MTSFFPSKTVNYYYQSGLIDEAYLMDEIIGLINNRHRTRIQYFILITIKKMYYFLNFKTTLLQYLGLSCILILVVLSLPFLLYFKKMFVRESGRKNLNIIILQ